MTSVAEPCARLVRVPMVVLFVLVVVESAIFFKPLSQFQVEEMNARLLIVQKHARALTRQDRKSTRLNSSHVSISYAVFCLKKKIHTLKQLIRQNRSNRKMSTIW